MHGCTNGGVINGSRLDAVVQRIVHGPLKSTRPRVCLGAGYFVLFRHGGPVSRLVHRALCKKLITHVGEGERRLSSRRYTLYAGHVTGVDCTSKVVGLVDVIPSLSFVLTRML